ncbi:MAG TPA: hypothetical protein DCM05_16015 [Elusimicrobia bacterium]|nr:hypothetical protein [Elusimicrobiota bacterium]
MPAAPRRTAAWGLLACAAACFCLPILNPDIFWHLSAARWILEHRSLPRADWLSHTMAGKPWVDFEWLFQLLAHGAWSAAGFRGLWLLKLACFSAAAALLWRALALSAVSQEARAAGVLAWALGLSTANDLRPENFSVLFFLLLWLRLETHRLRATEPGPLEKAACVLLFTLWANLHAGFLYGLVLLGIFAAGDVLRHRRRSLVLCLLLAAAAPLLNPYGLAVYRVLWEHAAVLGELKAHIQEWQEPTLEARWLWPFWAVLAASFLAVLRRQLLSKDVPGEHLAGLLLFALSAAGHTRTTVYFLCVAVPVLAAALPPLPRRDGLLALAAAAELAFFAWKVVPAAYRLQAFSPRYVPAQLTHFLEAERSVLGAKNLFNPWHWGGYLGWRLEPDYPVFVDGRYLFHGLLAPTYAATRTPEAFQAFLDSHGIETAILERTRQLTQVTVTLKDKTKTAFWRPFYLFYMPRKDWALVYWDAQGLVFVRRSAVPAVWLKEREFTAFRPEDLTAAAAMLADGALRRADLEGEVERYVREAGVQADETAARAWLEGLP